MEANSIDEYLELTSKGVKEITIDNSNTELMDFVMNEMLLPKIDLLKKYRINTKDGEYFYTLDSILPFGKHKNNVLKFVYKCDPYYIEWCLLNADSFCISKDALKILQNVRTWIFEDLKFINNGGEIYILDIRELPKDKYGIPRSDKFREVPFQFSELALEENSRKLREKLNVYTVLRGSNWSSNNPVSFNTAKKSIKILV